MQADVYVIRRRKAGGKGWEYLGDDDDWVSLVQSTRFPEIDLSRLAPGEQWARLVPTVRWYHETVDGGRCQTTRAAAHVWVVDSGGRVVRVTTWRVETGEEFRGVGPVFQPGARERRRRD